MRTAIPVGGDTNGVEVTCGVVRITSDVIVRIAKRRRLLRLVREEDDSLDEMQFRDGTCSFYEGFTPGSASLSYEDSGEEADDDEEEDASGDSSFDDATALADDVELPDETATWNDRMCISETGVCWEAIVKHTDIVVRTRVIEYGSLDEFVEPNPSPAKE